MVSGTAPRPGAISRREASSCFEYKHELNSALSRSGVSVVYVYSFSAFLPCVCFGASIEEWHLLCLLLIAKLFPILCQPWKASGPHSQRWEISWWRALCVSQQKNLTLGTLVK